jgi:NagD protein
VQLGFHTVLVLSGGTRREDLQRYAYRPDIVVNSLADLAGQLTTTDWQPHWLPVRPMVNGKRALHLSRS